MSLGIVIQDRNTVFRESLANIIRQRNGKIDISPICCKLELHTMNLKPISLLILEINHFSTESLMLIHNLTTAFSDLKIVISTFLEDNIYHEAMLNSGAKCVFSKYDMNIDCLMKMLKHPV